MILRKHIILVTCNSFVFFFFYNKHSARHDCVLFSVGTFILKSSWVLTDITRKFYFHILQITDLVGNERLFPRSYWYIIYLERNANLTFQVKVLCFGGEKELETVFLFSQMSYLIEIKWISSFDSPIGKNKKEEKYIFFLFKKISHYYFFNYTKFNAYF